MKLTIIITCLDDYQECQSTIASIRSTAGDKPEIIVVDDASQIPLTLEDKNCLLLRNEERAGVAGSRHLAALHATGDLLLLVDAHMRFENGWYEAAMQRAKDRPTTMHCCTCIHLTPGNMDMAKAKGEYNGASINFYGPDRNKPDLTQFVEGIWLPPKPGDDFPIACVMGASYLMPKDFFLHVGGLRLLRDWGYDEPYLSLKWWLAGGDIRILKTVRIGHQFRQQSSYRTDTWKLWYNRLVIIKTCLPSSRQKALIGRMPHHLPELVLAKNRMSEDSNLILTEQAYLQSIFVRSFDWFLSYFGISFPP